MKVAVSVPEPIFRAADRLAVEEGRSRSEVYAKALAEYIRRHDDDAITKAWDAVAADADATEADWVHRTSRCVLEHVEE